MRSQHITVPLLLLGLGACGSQPVTPNSATKTVNIPASEVKWQSIGNCWLYASMGWVESMILRSTGGQLEMNFSESYLTYYHFFYKLNSTRFEVGDKIATGGLWSTSRNLILRHGVMFEGDFLPNENDETRSSMQAYAESVINAKLADSTFVEQLIQLNGSEKRQLISTLLDEAFQVTMAEKTPQALSASSVQFTNLSGQQVTLADELYKWSHNTWKSYLDRIDRPSISSEPLAPVAITDRQQNLLRRVMERLNAGEPVVMNWFVDFNALDNRGVFSLERLKSLGAGSQGYHQTVIQDYVVEYRDPVTGRLKTTPEGEITRAERDMAARLGKLKYFIVKNSWGGAERRDRASYLVNDKAGYSRLEADYLFGWMGRKAADSSDLTGMETGLTGFILPR